MGSIIKFLYHTKNNEKNYWKILRKEATSYIKINFR